MTDWLWNKIQTIQRKLLIFSVVGVVLYDRTKGNEWNNNQAVDKVLSSPNSNMIV